MAGAHFSPSISLLAGISVASEEVSRDDRPQHISSAIPHTSAGRIQRNKRPVGRDNTVQEYIRRTRPAKSNPILESLVHPESLQEIDAIKTQTASPTPIDADSPPSEPTIPEQNPSPSPTPATEDNTEDAPSSDPEYPPFTPSAHSISDLFHKTKETMSKEYSQKLGHAYILSSPSRTFPFYKIGESKIPKTREAQHRTICKLDNWTAHSEPALPIRQPLILEKLAQIELKNSKYDPRCRCSTAHSEYFWGERSRGLDTLRFWARWLRDKEPYDERDQLKAFWVDRLLVFQGGIDGYFHCGADGCMGPGKRERDGACQACLRAGWQRFTEPTPREELEYICRIRLPWPRIRNLIQNLGDRGWLGVHHLIAFVNLVGWILHIQQWMVELRLFYGVTFLRLFVTILQPEAFTHYALAFKVLDGVLMMLAGYHWCRHGAATGGTVKRPTTMRKSSRSGSGSGSSMTCGGKSSRQSDGSPARKRGERRENGGHAQGTERISGAFEEHGVIVLEDEAPEQPAPTRIVPVPSLSTKETITVNRVRGRRGESNPVKRSL